MKTIAYRVHYNGVLAADGGVGGDSSTEVVTVRARDINSGFGKALKRAKEPLGNGRVREISSVEFWEVK